jgi:hypothetical protein
MNDKLVKHLDELQDAVDAGRMGMSSDKFQAAFESAWDRAQALIPDSALVSDAFDRANRDLSQALEEYRKAPSPAQLRRIGTELGRYRRAALSK